VCVVHSGFELFKDLAAHNAALGDVVATNWASFKGAKKNRRNSSPDAFQVNCRPKPQTNVEDAFKRQHDDKFH